VASDEAAADEHLTAPRSSDAPFPAVDDVDGGAIEDATPRPTVTPSSVVAPVLASAPDSETEQGDWLDRICPYLLSEDGSYRSTRPDEGHRCTAQDPPETLPLAFQERFCLTDRHVRCEMFKHAESARGAALEEAGGSVAQVQSARFKPSVRSVPLALGPLAGEGDDGRSRRNIIIGAAAVGGAVLFILLVILLSGGPRDGAVPGESPSLQPGPTAVATLAATPGTVPTATPGAGSSAAPESTPVAADGTQLIEYEVQEDELLQKIAESFATTRRRIIRANEGMADRRPYVEVGDIILVPASAELTIEEMESIPGFLALVE
jgi:hypothetical protein